MRIIFPRIFKGRETNVVYMFSSGFPLAAISFARIFESAPVTIPGRRYKRGKKAGRNSSPKI
jgi:hypothetical protein